MRNTLSSGLRGNINAVIMLTTSTTVGHFPGLAEGVGLLHFMNNENMT